MARVFGPSGVVGIDVKTDRGTRTYDADKKGFINITNANDLKQALSEGFTKVADYSGVGAVGYPCPCGFNSVFRKCSKCGQVN